MPTLVATLALLALLTVLGVPADASFPGHNGHVAFTAQCGNSSCIKVTTLAGKSETIVPSTSGADHAHYSPDGKVLVFDREGSSGCCQIYTVHIDGTHLKRITHGSDDEDPAWSPNGKQIVFSRQPASGTGQLFIVNADGTHLHPLTKGSIGGSEPDWSVNGVIAFQGTGKVGNDIFAVKPDGTHEKDLTNGAPSGVGGPNWSPNGKWITFIGGTDVWRMRADGTQKKDLTNSGSLKDHPAYSPDGSMIVYQDTVTGFNELWVMRSDGSNPKQVTHDNASDGAPNWQPL